MGNILLLYVVFDPEYIYKGIPCPYIGRLCLLYYMTILNCKFKNMYVINFCHFVVIFGKVDDKFSIKFRKKKVL